MGATNLAFQITAFAVASNLKRSTSATGQTTLLQKGSTLPLSLLACWTPSGGGQANPAASCDALKVNENFVKSVDWDFSLFLEITPEEMFSSLGPHSPSQGDKKLFLLAGEGRGSACPKS